MRKKIIFLLMATMCLVTYVKAEDILVDDFTIKQGETMEVPVELLNENDNLTAFSFILTLPEGLTLTEVTATDRFAGQVTFGSASNPNEYFIAGVDLDLGAISGTSGNFLTFKVTASNTFQGGEGTVSKIDFITDDRQHVSGEDISFLIDYESAVTVRLGDANLDEIVDVTDVMTIVSYILGDRPSPFSVENADYNKDNIIDVTDVMLIVNHILGN